jgi:hypothetical protein
VLDDLLRLILNSAADTIANRVYRQRRSTEVQGRASEFRRGVIDVRRQKQERRPANSTLPFPRAPIEVQTRAPFGFKCCVVGDCAQGSALRRRFLC